MMCERDFRERERVRDEYHYPLVSFDKTQNTTKSKRNNANQHTVNINNNYNITHQHSTQSPSFYNETTFMTKKLVFH